MVFLRSLVWLTGALLLAAYMRTVIDVGAPAVFIPKRTFLLPAAILIAGLVIGWLWGRSAMRGRYYPPPHVRFLLNAAAIGLFIALTSAPNDGFFILYFFFVALILCLFGIFLPYRIYTRDPAHNLLDDLKKLWSYRVLTGIWLSHNVRSRYRQTLLGVIWIILLPLMTSLVLTFAFTIFLRINIDVPFIAFFLAGLIPYNLFNIGVLNSTGAVINRLPLITQIYFPREVIVLFTIGEAIVDFSFTFCAMLVINAVQGIWPNANFIYLPLLFAVLVLLTLAFMLIASALSVLVRDIPQLIYVAMQLLYYSTPVIYPVEQLPEQYRWFFLINPLAPVVQAFRDVIIYNRIPQLNTLIYPALFGSVMLYLGYCVFKSIEGNMADMI